MAGAETACSLHHDYYIVLYSELQIPTELVTLISTFKPFFNHSVSPQVKLWGFCVAVLLLSLKRHNKLSPPFSPLFSFPSNALRTPLQITAPRTVVQRYTSLALLSTMTWMNENLHRLRTPHLTCLEVISHQTQRPSLMLLPPFQPTPPSATSATPPFSSNDP